MDKLYENAETGCCPRFKPEHGLQTLVVVMLLSLSLTFNN